MAVSLGALVFFGILLLLVFVALLCVGTSGSIIEVMAQKMGLKSNHDQERGVDFTDKSNIAAREQRMTVEEDVSARYEVNPSLPVKDNSGNNRGENTDAHEAYDYPTSSTLDNKATDNGAAENRAEKDKIVKSRNLNGNLDPSVAHDDKHVYQNTRVGRVTPKPAPRKIVSRKQEIEKDSDTDQPYQNVSFGKS